MHHEFTWFEWFSKSVTQDNLHVYTGAFVAAIIILCALIYKKTLKPIAEEIVPGEKPSLKNLFQITVEGVLGLMEGVIGPDARLYFPLVGTLFIYIFINNLMGTIPGFLPATSNVNTNFACAITVFVYYNYLGIKKQGFKKYLKHFAAVGQLPWFVAIFIVPLIFSIELISHLIRPLTLTIRLFGNLTGDHIVLGIFSDMVPVLVPVIFMAFGIFISFIQAFVFALLSTVYIGLAVAQEEH
jgi:F-type H+-transporting ATPase subunit a